MKKYAVVLCALLWSVASFCVDDVVAPLEEEQVSQSFAQRWLPQSLQSLRSAPSRLKKSFRERMKKRFPKLWESPYEDQVARVFVGNAISQQEKQATQKRTQNVTQKVRSQFGLRRLRKTPKIAIAASGGGLRASLGTLGVLTGLEKTGLLDAVTWLSTLSGSAWAVGSWMQYASVNPGLTVQNYSKLFVEKVSDKYIANFTPQSMAKINPLLLINSVYDKPQTTITLFGAMISNLLFGSQSPRLSEQTAVASTGKYPIPLYTAISREKKERYQWLAFSPWTVAIEPFASGGQGYAIPTWGFGREFFDGQSVGYKPEMSLGFDLGTFGSAFAADIEKIFQEKNVEETVKNPFIKSVLNYIKDTFGYTRFTYSEVLNFTNGMAGAPFSDQKTLRMVDAGIAFNFPYPPVSGMRKERTPDILILIDASGDLSEKNEIKRLENYAREKGLKLPDFEYDGIDQRAVSIFEDSKNPAVPTVIYIPVIKDDELIAQKGEQFPDIQAIAELNLAKCCGDTAKGVNPPSGTYSTSIAQSVVDLMEFNVRASEQELWNAIRKRTQ